MSQSLNAIFENGVLRPIEALDLPERSAVRITIDSGPIEDREITNDSQQDALNALFKRIDPLPQRDNGDGWSASNADELLYGQER